MTASVGKGCVCMGGGGVREVGKGEGWTKEQMWVRNYDIKGK